MAKIFDVLSSAMTDEPTTENIDKPLKDWVQETWLEYIRQKTIPATTTLEEFISLLSHDEGLLATIFRTRMLIHYREQRKSPNTCTQLQDDDPIIDEGFERVEYLDLLENDERIASLSEKHREAVKRFIVAWWLVEEGYKIPNSLSQRIRRDRKETGLPLVLPTGKPSGSGGINRSVKKNERISSRDDILS